MVIKKAELYQFRNYGEVILPFHERVNLFLGENAQGKTNLLESLYLSAFGKSFRTGRDNEMIRFGEEYCRVKIEAERKGEDITVEIAVGKEGKGVKVNGLKIKKTAELLENVLIVVFSPEDLKIVKEDPEKRRRFIDRELCQIKPSYFVDFSAFRKVLQQRNALLKEKNVKAEEIEIWDEPLSDYGAKIIHKREEFVKKLNIISGRIHQGITNGREEIEIIYESNIPYRNELKEQKSLFYKELKETLKRDIYRGNTGSGPHRDDLIIRVNGVDIRHFGSQGQQRTAALSLKMAEISLIKEETGENAILLLDDVLSELDNERQHFLIHSLEDVQLFITTTEVSQAIKDKLPKGYIFHIKEGSARVEEA